MKNVGFDIFKPDIHVRRLLTNLKLVPVESSTHDICEAMMLLSSQSGLKVVELDTLFFIFGKLTHDGANYSFKQRHEPLA